MADDKDACLCALDHHDPLRAVLQGTASETGERFFGVLVTSLSSALKTRYAWVTEYRERLRRLKTLAFCMDERLQAPFEIDIDGTPCEKIIDHAQFVHYPDNILELFPASAKLRELGAVSYMGVPLTDLTGAVLGHLAVIDDQPMPQAPRNLALFKIFAARAAAELRRIRTEKALRGREAELQALVDSAMDGIVELDEDMRVVRMNPAACSVFGLAPEAGAGEPFSYFLTSASRDKLGQLIERLDTLPPAKRALWVAGGLEAIGSGHRLFTAEVTVSCFQMHGHRFLTLILRNVNDRLEAERRISRLEQETEYLREQIRSLDDSAEIVGKSDALKTVLRSAAQVAPTDSTVLIQGETGTGKELIARYVHRHSPRAESAFIKLNCAALQPTLVESELFGHEKGAFTGASQQRQGRFELAGGGTIFLDEVSEIPMELQAKLLRVLQEGQFERVGGAKTRKVDVRVIAATNRRLNAAVVGGRFRADLFYRLNVYPITVPPLRARPEDIPPLVQHFTFRIAARMGKKIETIPAATMDALMAYDWPGNVRELRNVIERAIITSSGPALFLPETLEAVSIQPATGPEETPQFDSLAAVERHHIARVLQATGWRISGERGAAAVLGLNPSTLRYRIKKLQIHRPWKG
jgi:PAS domain S-box-containing protein